MRKPKLGSWTSSPELRKIVGGLILIVFFGGLRWYVERVIAETNARPVPRLNDVAAIAGSVKDTLIPALATVPEPAQLPSAAGSPPMRACGAACAGPSR